MSLNKKRNFINTSIFVIISMLVLAAAGYYFFFHHEESGGQKEEQTETFGVIDYDVLMKEHPAYNDLIDLEKKIMSIDPDPIDAAEMERIGSDLGKKMDLYQQQLEEMLEKERNQLFEETTKKIKELQEKLNTEYEKRKQALFEYREALEKEYGPGESSKPLTDFEKKFTTRMQAKSRDLLILKERQIAARRLELAKKSQEKLLARKESIETSTIEFEEKLRAQNQNMKLELQLKLQVAKSDEEREKIQSQLESLFDEEQKKVDEFRKVMIADFTKLENEELEKNEALLKKIEANVDADVEKQIDKIRKEVADEMVKEGLLAVEDENLIPREIKDRLEARQKQVEQEMKQLQEEVNRQISELEKQSQAEFEQRKTMIIKKLESYQAGLAQEYDRKRNELIREMESANTEKSQARKELLERRQKLSDRMIQEINEKVQEIAMQKKIDIVLGMSETNLNAIDLTEESKAAVRKIKIQNTTTESTEESQPSVDEKDNDGKDIDSKGSVR
jgi:hypothetical protein